MFVDRYEIGRSSLAKGNLVRQYIGRQGEVLGPIETRNSWQWASHSADGCSRVRDVGWQNRASWLTSSINQANMDLARFDGGSNRLTACLAWGTLTPGISLDLYK